MSNKNGLLKSILPWVVLLFLIGGLVTYMNQGNSKEIKYSEFVEVVQDEKIKEVEIVPSSLVVDVSGLARGNEWRTTPLWGIGLQ